MSLKDILSGENVVANINENMDKILSYIPEISFLIGFDQTLSSLLFLVYSKVMYPYFD